MEKLTDFKPLRSVQLPGVGKLECSGLVVIVGPNSSGKSQFLQDIYHRMAGMPRGLVVASEVEIGRPPYDPLMRCLEDEGYVTMFTDSGGAQRIRARTLYLGQGEAVGEIQPSQAKDWYNTFSSETTASPKRPSDFLRHFGRMLVTALFLDRRLTSLSATSLIDFETQSPQHDLHALYLDDQAKARLRDEMVTSFGRVVWPDMSRGNSMSLKVSDDASLPTADDRHSPKKMAGFRSIETEGDGLKSYVATCVALLLGKRPVCLIDEPELCLHPPQAYNLGRFIGRFGTSPETVTFVATHSSYVLRGIIQTAPSVQIIRLTRRNKVFSAHLVPASSLAEALSRPTLKAEAVLDGIFAQAVLVVEADGDRAVYQAVWEKIGARFRIDIHFATVGGTGGIADTCRLYRSLQIPIAVVADLDMLVDDDKMSRVIRALVGDSDGAGELVEMSKGIAKDVRGVPPEVSPSDVAAAVGEITKSRMDWSMDDDTAIKRSLVALTKRIDRMRRLKKGGVDAFPEPLRARLMGALERLSEIGLFLVPVGELEEWLPGVVSGSKSNKSAWANEAAQKIATLNESDTDVWAFVAKIGRCLAAE